MRLTDEQVEAFQTTGILILKNVFPAGDVGLMRDTMHELAHTDHPTNLTEVDGSAMRALHGCDEHNRVMWNLVRDPRLLIPAQQMLGGDVYLHQFKVSMKAAFNGDLWKWHQDFMYWHHEDGLPESRAVTAAVYVNEVTQFNAPTWVIPGSHREGLLRHRDPDLRGPKPGLPAWQDNVIADFKYILENDEVTRLAKRSGIVSATGPAGTVLFFHSSTVHASTWNLSPYERIVILITYNAVANKPRLVRDQGPSHRPQFLVNRDYAALTSVAGLSAT
jgi:ectoine hydroxylase-related dioxygenase (phytanoyl-CoA dioxygenase family)